MAKCKLCGATYDEDQIKEDIWEVCGKYVQDIMDGFCYDCALQVYYDETGIDVLSDFESLTEEETETQAREFVSTRVKRGGIIV